MLLLVWIKLIFSVLLPGSLVDLSTTGLSRRLWLVCAMEQDDDSDRDNAVRKELQYYANHWQTMAVMENRAVYGPVESSWRDRLGLLRGGQMIYASLSIVEDGGWKKLVASWEVGECEREGSQAFVHEARESKWVVISRTHPLKDRLLCAEVKDVHVKSKVGSFTVKVNQTRFHDAAQSVGVDAEKEIVTSELLAQCRWRVDIAANGVQLHRVFEGINAFTKVSEKPTVFQKLLGAYVHSSDVKANMNTAPDVKKCKDAARLNPMWSQLNETQQEAVDHACEYRVCLIQGPPGTGKTKVAEAIVSIFQALRDVGGQGHVLAVAPSKVAADNVARRLLQGGMAEGELMRFGDPASSDLKHIGLEDILDDQFPLPSKRAKWPKSRADVQKERKIWMAAQSRVLVGTLEMSYKLDGRFRLVLVDECAQATEPFTVIPLGKADPNARLILIGDHRQLPPTVKDKRLDGYGTSLFLRATRMSCFKTHMLNVQYRMAPTICAWPSMEYYGGRLVNDVSTHAHKPPKGFPWPLESSFAFVSVQGTEERSVTNSVSNESEALVVLAIVDALLRGGEVTARNIGVISPYASQTNLIRALSKSTGKRRWYCDMTGVDMKNIDSFQGEEREVIVVSLARCNDEGDLGFVDDAQRLNVALTRAKRGLVVVGDADTLSRAYQSGLKSLIQSVERRGLKIYGNAHWSHWLARDGRQRSQMELFADKQQDTKMPEDEDGNVQTPHQKEPVASWIPHLGESVPDIEVIMPRMAGIVIHLLTRYAAD